MESGSPSEKQYAAAIAPLIENRCSEEGKGDAGVRLCQASAPGDSPPWERGGSRGSADLHGHDLRYPSGHNPVCHPRAGLLGDHPAGDLVPSWSMSKREGKREEGEGRGGG
eukprot:761596-Hanusia_phi.AAC.6